MRVVRLAVPMIGRQPAHPEGVPTNSGPAVLVLASTVGRPSGPRGLGAVPLDLAQFAAGALGGAFVSSIGPLVAQRAVIFERGSFAPSLRSSGVVGRRSVGGSSERQPLRSALPPSSPAPSGR